MEPVTRARAMLAAAPTINTPETDSALIDACTARDNTPRPFAPECGEPSIVQRLRDSAQISVLPLWQRNEFDAAADEIERLRAALNEIRTSTYLRHATAVAAAALGYED